MAQRMDKVEPKPGDLIEIPREGYKHWAIYVGDGYVIHLTTPNGAGSSSKSLLNEKAIVKKEKLDVVGGNDWHINNLLDDKYEPRSVGKILKDAESRVGQELPYCVFQGNCEHFVTQLRYGKPESQQGRRAMLAVAGVGAGAVIGLGLLAGTSVLLEQKNNKGDEDRKGGGSA